LLISSPGGVTVNAYVSILTTPGVAVKRKSYKNDGVGYVLVQQISIWDYLYRKKDKAGVDDASTVKDCASVGKFPEGFSPLTESSDTPSGAV